MLLFSAFGGRWCGSVEKLLTPALSGPWASVKDTDTKQDTDNFEVMARTFEQIFVTHEGLAMGAAPSAEQHAS